MNRTENCRSLISLARELLPADLFPDFRRSLDVPQFGPYHNEGPFMDSHLDLVLTALENAEDGEIPRTVPRPIQELMYQALESVSEDLAYTYALLHDLDKGNCLTFVSNNGEATKTRVSVSWEGWLGMLRVAGEDGRLALEGDGKALYRVCRKKGISQISYWNPNHGNHAKVTAKRLASRSDIPPIVVTAIAEHELAFNAFGKVNQRIAKQVFTGKSKVEAGFTLLVNWADTTGSLGRDGRPDITGFLNMADSYLALRLE